MGRAHNNSLHASPRKTPVVEVRSRRVKFPITSIYYNIVCKVIHLVVIFLLQYFTGSRDKDSVTTQPINSPILARFIKIRPRGWRSHICMRVEFYGCAAGKHYMVLRTLEKSKKK